MSYIGINSMDLSLLSNDIKEIKEKISGVKEILDSEYDSVKEMNFYDSGFKNIYEYLEQELLVLTDVKSKIEKYQSDVLEVEKKYDKIFDNIVVPNIVSNSSSLTVATPVITTETNDKTIVSNPVVSTNVATNNNVEKKETPTTEYKTEPTETVSNNNIEKSKEEKTVENKVSSESKESKENGSNVFGILAGAVGAAGAIGAGALAAAHMKSKNDEEEQEEKEEKNNTEYSNIVKEY